MRSIALVAALLVIAKECKTSAPSNSVRFCGYSPFRAVRDKTTLRGTSARVGDEKFGVLERHRVALSRGHCPLVTPGQFGAGSLILFFLDD